MPATYIGNDRCSRCGGASGPCPVCNPIEEPQPRQNIMTKIDRNPDVNLTEGESIPADCYLEKGKFLMATARSAGIPYGICKSRVYLGSTAKSRIETIGLIIRNKDRIRFRETLRENKAANAKKKGKA